MADHVWNGAWHAVSVTSRQMPVTRELIDDDDDDDESIMSGDAFVPRTHVLCVMRSRRIGPARGSANRTVHSCRATCGSMHSTGVRRDERGTISSDGTASGGPVQQQKQRRTHVSMQAGRNRHAGIAPGAFEGGVRYYVLREAAQLIGSNGSRYPGSFA